jgi:hypothetical protein
MHESPKATQASNFPPLRSRSFLMKVLGDLGWDPAIPTLPPVQNRRLDRKECERGS